MASLLHSEDGHTPDQPEPCSSGPCGGLVEALTLVCIIPDYWRLAMITFFGAASGLLPAIFYIGPIESQIWGDHASEYASWSNAAQFFFAFVGAPLFGKWSDGRPRKISVIIMAVAGLLRVIPLVVWQGDPSTEEGQKNLNIMLIVASVVTALTGPFVAQLSGSPVMYAWMGDKIPPQHRETGFSVMNCFGSLAVWTGGIGGSILVGGMGWTNMAYVYLSVLFGAATLLLIITAPKDAPRPVVETDEEPHKGVFTDLISPLKLIMRKRSLRLICGLAAFITLPDVAGTYISATIVYVLMGVAGNSSDFLALQGSIGLYFNLFPNIFLLPVYFLVGVMAKRFGPAPFLAVFTPIACIAFAVPSLLDTRISGPSPPDPAWIVTGQSISLQILAGLCMCLPLAIYPPLSALVTQMVPAHRLGEGMGAVAACKNMASLIAPVAMALILGAMPVTGYVWIFPGGAVVMLCGAWPFSYLLAQRVSQDVDFQWSAWTSIRGQGSVLGGSVQGKAEA